MAVNTELAHLSDTLFTTAIATYALAMVGYCAEYAFGGRGRVADTAAAPITVRVPAATRVPAESARVPVESARVLAGAGGPDVVDRAVVDRADVDRADVDRAGVSSTPDASRPARADAPPTDPPGTRRTKSERAGEIAVGITLLGALIHLTSILLRGYAVHRVPWGNMYEFSMVMGFIAVVAWLVVLWRMPALRFLGMFVLIPVVAIMFLAGNVLYAKAAPLVPALQSYWLAIHVSAAASGEGMLMTSSVLTILYLVKVRWAARTAAGKPMRFINGLGARLPEPASLDKSAYRIVAFAFPIFTFGVICGAIWAEAAWGRYWGWDPKETWAFIAWVIYAAYLHARATAGWKGRNAAYINLLGFGAMTFNFFIINIFISGLHSYAGLN
jgi:cytochrome c-type biogenesis protein CcsB